HSAYTGFATWVDGHRVKVQRVVSKIYEEGYDALWLKTVAFRRGQSRIIQVSYRAPHSTVAGSGLCSSYDFTGGNWRGKVEQSDLAVTTHLPGLYYLNATFGLKGIPLRQRGNHFYFRWTNWQADGEFGFWQSEYLRGWLVLSDSIGVTGDDVMLDTPVA